MFSGCFVVPLFFSSSLATFICNLMGFCNFCFNSFIFVFYMSITNFLCDYHEAYIGSPTAVYFKLKTTWLLLHTKTPHFYFSPTMFYVTDVTIYICLQCISRGWRGLEPGHAMLQGTQLALMLLGLLPKAQGGVTPPRSLGG